MTALAAPVARGRSALGFGIAGAVALVMLIALALGEPLIAAAVPLAAAAVFGLYQLPPRVSVFAIIFLVLSLEGLQYALGPTHLWEVPVLSDIARTLLFNLGAVTGVSALRAPLIDVATLALFAVSMARHPRDGWAGEQPTVRAMHLVLWTSAGCAAVLVALGVAQGGSFDDSLWQVRHVMMFPVRAVVIMRALDCTRDELRLLGRLLVAAAVLKASIGLYFFYVIAPASGEVLEFTTSHTDTMLFVPALALFLAQLIESRSARHLLTGLFWVPIVFWGLVCNDRRVAYVSLCIGAVVMLVMAPPTVVKRVLGRALLFVTPALPFYVAAGWSSPGTGWFFPVGVLKSLVVGEQRYTGEVDYRELENLNVLYTWSQHKVLPTGFGHKFDLFFPMPDISSWFEMWQFHPHNSYLWLFAIGGPVGFTLMMLPHVATLYLCARSYRASTDFTQRVALLVAIVTVIAYFNQIWGDMGTLAWTPSWTAAFAAALGAKLAMKTGAWPAVLRVRRDDGP